MCMGGGGSTPPVAAAVAPAPAPKSTDPAVTAAKQNARTVAARAGGRGSTLLGGELLSEPGSSPVKSLLGQ